MDIKHLLENQFQLAQNKTTIGREVLGGATTFATMAYIIFVQPVAMSLCGMDFDAVMVATCISSAIAIFLMAFLTNYPIALAPAMGHNFYFALMICGRTFGYSWRAGLAAVFISGSIFLLLSLFGVRSRIINIIPVSLMKAIAVGIGLLIALIGLQWGGIIVKDPATMVKLGDLHSPVALLTVFGLVVTVGLYVRRYKSALIVGILASTVLAIFLGMMEFKGIFSAPPSIAPTFLQLDFKELFSKSSFITVILVLFFLDMFDTVGTLVGVTSQAGLMVDGELPKAERALFSDACGTVVGALSGTSTVTSYIESAAGVSAGARTGLANVVTGLLFLLALFFSPLISMVGGGIVMAEGAPPLYPITSPVLIIVGVFMMMAVKEIEWDDKTLAVPAFLTIVIIPLSFSITDGIAFGFISLSFTKLASGRIRELHWSFHIITVIFLMRYVLGLT